MNFRLNANFTPDGFSSAPAAPRGKDRAFFANVTAAASTHAQAPATHQSRRSTDVATIHHNQDGYDEGLVHSHGWAASDR